MKPKKQLSLNVFGASLDRTECGHGVIVSTIRLDVDHGKPGGPPKWYETMVFGGRFAGRQWLYTTAEQAMNGHKEAVKLAQESGPHDKDVHRQRYI